MNQIWDELGVAPTDDARAIRRAYANKLRAMDVDADPAAFETLRRARDLALNRGEPPEAEFSAPEPEAMAEALDALRAAPATLAPPEAPLLDQPVPGVPTDPAELHMQAITALLHREREARWLEPAEKVVLRGHWHELVADPRMEEVSFYDRIERWAVWAILSSVPVSAPLIVLAVDHFGWMAEQGSISQTQALADITHRYRLIHGLERSRQRGHPYQPAWTALTDRRTSLSGTNSFMVSELVGIIRNVMPELERELDPELVAMWVDSGTNPCRPEEVGPVTAERIPPRSDDGSARGSFRRHAFKFTMAVVIMVAIMITAAFA